MTNTPEEMKSSKKAVASVKKIGEKVVNKVGKLFKGDKRGTVNPAKDITGQKLICVKEFLSLFRLKRKELHNEITRLNEQLSH